MRIHLRGIQVEFADDDPRAVEIERLVLGALAGRPAAPGADAGLVVVAAPAAAKPEPAPPPPPPIPLEFQIFWRELKPVDRRELVLLSQRVWPIEELEREMGWGPDELRGRHARLGRLARECRLYMPVRARGNGRAHRKYCLRPAAAAAWVRALAAESEALPVPLPRPG